MRIIENVNDQQNAHDIEEDDYGTDILFVCSLIVEGHFQVIAFAANDEDKVLRSLVRVNLLQATQQKHLL